MVKMNGAIADKTDQMVKGVVNGGIKHHGAQYEDGEKKHQNEGKTKEILSSLQPTLLRSVAG